MTSAIPARHPSEPCAVPPGIRLFSLMMGLRKPDATQFRRLGECLTVGDPLADRLVEWMYTAGSGSARPLFERALADGIDTVDDAPEPLRAFFDEVEATPAWVDRDKVALGAEVMRGGGADGLYIARDVALLGGYMFAGFNQTLLRTGALEKGSNARFAETAQWALDVITEHGLDSRGVGYRSTVHVRFIHAMVRRHVGNLPDWDADAWGVPVNQTDMAATLVGALVAPIMGGVGLGKLHTPKEYEAVAHLTRYVGWLMGVQEEFLPRDFRDSIRVLFHTSCALSTPDETTRQLSLPMIDDPLRWHYETLPGLRRRIARSQHLSITGTFLGPHAMRTLGLPAMVVPWYPLLRFPVNAVRSVAALRRGGRARAAVRGMAEHEKFMRTMIDSDATIGHAAAGITHNAA
ncbi:oxygenase MpaB family protein [Rhodococcus triatomae]